MRNSRVNFLVKIPIHCWDINKTRQGITFICFICRCNKTRWQNQLWA